MIKLSSLVNEDYKLGKMDIKLGQVVSNPFARAFAPQIKEGEDTINKEDGPDHEVSMAYSSLESIIKSCEELKSKLGDSEKDIPAWIQDHISNSENYINQAAKGYYDYKNESVNEAAPCWKGYTQYGMKDKGGKQVPNCVPNESVVKESRSVKTIQTDYFKTIDAIQKELSLYKKHKGTPAEKKHIENLKKLNVVKNKLQNELDSTIYDDPLASKAKTAANKDIAGNYGPYNYDFD